MDRHQAWSKIRDTIPSSFYAIVCAENLEKEIRLSKPPSLKGQVNFTPFTDLERQNRELERLEELLEQERQTTRQKQEEFSKRWEFASEKQQDLDHVLQKFSHYYEDCQFKRKKDKARRQQYLLEAHKEDEGIQRLEHQLQVLQQIKETTARRRDLCEPYKDFLFKVVHEYNKSHKDEPPYKSIQDLLERFEYLKHIRDAKAKRVLTNLDQSAASLDLEKAEKIHSANEDLAYQAHTLKLMEYSQQLESYVGEMNEKVIRTKVEIQNEILEAERPRMATFALCYNLAKAVGQKIRVKESDVPGQLQFIGKFLSEMKKIPERVRESKFGTEEETLLVEAKNEETKLLCPEFGEVDETVVNLL